MLVGLYGKKWSSDPCRCNIYYIFYMECGHVGLYRFSHCVDPVLCQTVGTGADFFYQYP